MLRGGRLFLVLGMVLAVLAVLLGIIALSQRGQQATVTPTPAGVPVVVAARDIPAGTVLTADDVQVERVAQGAAAAGVVQSPSQVIGLVTANALVKGQQITVANLQSSGVSVALQPGKRAIALPVDRVTGVGGLVQPNDTIDLLRAIDPHWLTANITVAISLGSERVLASATHASCSKSANTRSISFSWRARLASHHLRWSEWRSSNENRASEYSRLAGVGRNASCFFRCHNTANFDDWDGYAAADAAR